MSSLSPSGSDPNTPAPPQQPGVSTAQPDRGADPALAGFLCGIVSFIASWLFSLNLITGAFGAPRLTAPGLSPHWRLLVIMSALIVAYPVVMGALVGWVLCFLGRHSPSRRQLAVVGMVLCVLALVPILVLMGAFVALVSSCTTHVCI